jgi:septum formation protein
MDWYPDYVYVLGSQSPRRQQLLKGLGLPFTVRVTDMSEDYPDGLKMSEIPVYLAQRKAEHLMPQSGSGEMLITADTIVWLKGEVLGKPGDETHAREILRKLSGQTHQVVTGVCLCTSRKTRTFFSVTDVEFKTLLSSEIDYYIREYKPFDKAGAYGIQEWIGLAGIIGINGSYFNVVGLPVQQVYEEILHFDRCK